MKYIQVQWTAPTLEEARTIAKALVESHLVACAQIIPEIESHYIWEGKLESSKEVKVLLKTRHDKFQMIRDYIDDKASYDVPEITAVPLLEISPAYAAWMSEMLH